VTAVNVDYPDFSKACSVFHGVL